MSDPTHWGVSPAHGGLIEHRGPADECLAPECIDLRPSGRCGVTWFDDGDLHECLWRHDVGNHRCDCYLELAVGPNPEDKQA